MKTRLIKDFDEARNNIKTDDKGRKALIEFRKKLVQTEKHSELLGEHFDYALNSGELNDKKARELGLM